MNGHVFVVEGDLTRLRCDAWLLPTDGSFHITEAWKDHVRDGDIAKLRHEGWGGRWVIRLPDRTEPAIWLANVGMSGEPSLSDEDRAARISSVVRAFVREASRKAPAAASTGRPPLLGMPLITTGHGGMSELRGALLRALFKHLIDACWRSGVDVAVVCWTRQDYSGAQRARQLELRNRKGRHQDYWRFPHDAHALHRHAERLASKVRESQLSLFVGAGLSASAGLPVWDALLEELSEDLAHRGGTPLKERSTLDPRDQATLLAERYRALGKPSDLNKAICEKLTTDQTGLSHSMLMSMPIDEIITTNFDQLLENADTGGRRAPDDTPPSDESALLVSLRSRLHGGNRWLLKLHGTVSREDSIVFTRSSYLDAPRRWGALFGLVQAMLLTRHMLFVGYSLSDEDFHNVVHEVREAIPGRNSTWGTVITLFPDPIMQELWANQLEVVSVRADHGPPDEDEDKRTRAAARDVDRFLDLVAFHASDHTDFLLDPNFVGIFDEDKRDAAFVDLQEALAPLQEQVQGREKEPGWSAVADLLRRMGAPRGEAGEDRGRRPYPAESAIPTNQPSPAIHPTPFGDARRLVHALRQLAEVAAAITREGRVLVDVGGGVPTLQLDPSHVEFAEPCTAPGGRRAVRLGIADPTDPPGVVIYVTSADVAFPPDVARANEDLFPDRDISWEVADAPPGISYHELVRDLDCVLGSTTDYDVMTGRVLMCCAFWWGAKRAGLAVESLRPQLDKVISAYRSM